MTSFKFKKRICHSTNINNAKLQFILIIAKENSNFLTKISGKKYIFGTK